MTSLPCLPIKSVLAEQNAGFSAPEKAGSVLVVDDDSFFACLMSETLRQANYTVCVARDARRALTELATGTFDCLVTDLYMPHESGFWLIDQAQQECPEIGVVVVSGTEPLNDLQKEARWPALEKPFRGSELLRVVRDAINRG